MELTDTMLLDKSYPSWITRDNCEIIAKILPTGRKAKNGEIYEGDIILANIIEFSVATRGCVVYDKENSCYANKNDGGLTPLYKLGRIEIIGSEYINPELLEVIK